MVLLIDKSRVIVGICTLSGLRSLAARGISSPMPVERVDSTSPPAILRAHEEATTGVHKKHRPGHDVKLPAVMLTSKFNNMMSCFAAPAAAAMRR